MGLGSDYPPTSPENLRSIRPPPSSAKCFLLRFQPGRSGFEKWTWRQLIAETCLEPLKRFYGNGRRVWAMLERLAVIAALRGGVITAFPCSRRLFIDEQLNLKIQELSKTTAVELAG